MLEEKYHDLYRDAVTNPTIEDHEMRRKIEQQRGIAYAMNLVPMLVKDIDDQIEARSYEEE
jgi:hypothetical protein